MAAGLRGEAEGAAELRGGGRGLGTVVVLAVGLGGRRGEERVERAEVGQIDVEVALEVVGRGDVRVAPKGHGALGVDLDLAGLDRGVVVGDDNLRVHALNLRAFRLKIARGHVERAVDLLVLGIGRGVEVAADVRGDLEVAAETGIGRAVGGEDGVELAEVSEVHVQPTLIGVGRGEAGVAAQVNGVLVVQHDAAGFDDGVVVFHGHDHIAGLHGRALGLQVADLQVEAAAVDAVLRGEITFRVEQPFQG